MLIIFHQNSRAMASQNIAIINSYYNDPVIFEPANRRDGSIHVLCCVITVNSKIQCIFIIVLNFTRNFMGEKILLRLNSESVSPSF